MMKGRLSAVALMAKHGDRVASVAADSVHYSHRMTNLSHSSKDKKTSHLLFTICAVCLFFSTGCAFSKNLLGKSNLQNTAIPVQTATHAEAAKPDCAVPCSPTKPQELTSYPVMPQAAAATGNAAPLNNGIPQQPIMQQPDTQAQPYAQQQQQPATQQQFVAQQPMIQQQQQQYIQQPQPAIPQQTAAFTQQPMQQPALPMAQTAIAGTANQWQEQATPPQVTSPQAVAAGIAEIAPAPEHSQLANPYVQQLPTARIEPRPNHPKEIGGPEMTAAPVTTLRHPARPGAMGALNCPPGTVPSYGYVADAISSPEKLAECEKQVFEMNQKLNELQFNTLKATLTMEQMAEQQRQLMIDNERLRRRAELADRKYLEELDSLSEIVGEVVSQAGTGNKSASASKTLPGANPLRSVPKSVTGQSL